MTDVPALGFFFASMFLLLALVARDRDSWARVGLLTLGLSSLGVLTALLTGDYALEVISGLPRTSGRAVSQHHVRATVASILAGLALIAGVATVVLRARRGGGSYSRRAVVVVLVVTVASAVALGWTSAAGGRINHPEIQEPEDRESAPAHPH